MNQNIKHLLEEYVHYFNPAVIQDNSPRKLMPQDTLNDILYYHPKDEKELRKYIKMLLADGITDLNCIDTSEITDFSYLFDQIHYGGIPLNMKERESLDISRWDVSRGKTFKYMFNGMFYASMWLNCNISNWNVGSGEDFSYMFAYNDYFNQDLSGWDIRNGNDFNHMFFECKRFDQDLSCWSEKFKQNANIRWMFKNTPINNTNKKPKKRK